MQSIYSDKVPAAIGPYSPALSFGSLVFLSGQIPLDPKSMQLCSEKIEAQIEQVFQNLKAICEAAGGSLAALLKLTIYLRDLAHFNLVNEAMQRYFSPPYPARAVIGVAQLPKDALIEIEGIMAKQDVSSQL